MRPLLTALLVQRLLASDIPAATTSTDAASAERALHRFMPCTPGLSVEYLDEPKDKASKGATLRVIDTVRGPGKEPHTCVLDRVTIHPGGKEERDAWARELLPDRITNAGWIDHPVAFRTPLLRAPVKSGRRWHFNTTDFVIKEVGDTFDVPAGTFDGCVRVHEQSADGKYEASSVYAPGVGLISYETRERRTRAVRVSATKPR
jgi:hypothetical protein